MTKTFYAAILVGILSAAPSYVSAQGWQPDTIAGVRSPATSVEDTWAILDKGEMVNVCGNQGIMTRSKYFAKLGNFRWPKSKGVQTNTGDVNAAQSASLLFGTKGNVIDAHSNEATFNWDWQGVYQGAGKYFADDQPSEIKATDGGPRMAHSDIPKTWPAGYFDSLKVWRAGPVGAYDALSAADQAVVTKRGAWYDEEKNLWRFWPGRFRIDMDSTSLTYRQQIPGQFAADREVYAIFNDRNTQPPDRPLGIQVEMQAYCWGIRFAQDVQFYDYTITNTGSTRLDSCSFGYFLNYRYGDPNEEAYTSYNSGINPAGYDNVVINWDPNGATDPVRGINNGYFGSAILATPKNLGVTDGHFFRGNTTYIPTKSKRNLWPVMISNPADPTIAANAANWFHGGANTRFDVFDSTYLVPSRWDFTQFAFIQATGLFSMDPGESVRGCIVFTAGATVDQFKRNIETAQKLFLAEYNGPSVPPSPKLTGVAGDRRNILYWTDEPESAVDVMKKKVDFEGYKIYRSQDQGTTWGTPVVDPQGRVIGYVPVAQFDRNNSVQGTDPVNSFNYLGSNTGTRHMWIDTAVVNGIQYSYTITSYDAGDPPILESFESSKGTTAADVNLVDLTPRSDAAGYQPPQYAVTKSATVGKATVSVTVADPAKIVTDQYTIRFNKTVADTFFLHDDAGALLARVPLASDEMKIADGIRVRVETDPQIGGVKTIADETGRIVSSSSSKNLTGLWFVTVKSSSASADTGSRASDYEFRFTQRGSFADTLPVVGQQMRARVQLPFEVWNVTGSNPQRQVNAVLEDANRNGLLNFGEGIRIVNTTYVNPGAPGDSLGIYATAKVPYTVKLDTLIRDSLNAKLPVTGQSFKVETYSAVTSKDTFHLVMKPSSLSASGMTPEQLLGRIRVVPNPYIGAARWEAVQNSRKLQFSFLPPVCKITIFTVRGELVKQIDHTNLTGTEDWNLTNRSGVEVAFGLYIYVVETPDGNKTTGKFAIIK